MTTETLQHNKLIAVYGRVSTSNQENEGTIETQLSAVNQHAQKNGYIVVKQYTDNGWSGDILARPALDQLRNDAKSKMWEAVLFYDPDRLARRYSYQELVMDELKEAGIEVMFVTISAPKNSEDKILHGVRGLFAEYERTKIAERFRLGKLRKVKDGHLLVSEPLYGYDYIKKEGNTHGFYKINEDEARVVRMIFQWVADDRLTIRGVVKKLHDLGIKPRKSKRGVWNTSTLSTMLRHKAYIGEGHWGSSYAIVPKNPLNTERYKKHKKTSRVSKPEADWIMIPVPPIIDKDLFSRARKQVEQNFSMCVRNKKNQYLLGGKIWCECGTRRSGEGPQHGKHLYYRCSNRVYSFPLPPSCTEKSINARIADDLVWTKIASLMSSPELLSKQIERWINAREHLRNAVPDNSISIKKDLSKLKEQEDRYNKAYGSGLYDMARLQEYLLPLKERRVQLESQLVQSTRTESSAKNPLMPTMNDIDTFAALASKKLLNLSFEAKRGIIMDVIDRIVATQAELKVYGFIPVPDTKNDNEYKLIHRHGEDTIDNFYDKYKPIHRHSRTPKRW